jgi:polyphosphate kinase 2 (PPK2 family)
MDPSLRWGDGIAMAIDLTDYEIGAPLKGGYVETLRELQERLSRILVAHIVYKRRSVVVIEGWDASGKGGAIQRMSARWDPRSFTVWPISAPTEEEKARHFLWRFWRSLPAAGEIAVFDRSWYGRVLVERVEAYATEQEWRRAYDEINEFEAQQSDDGTNIVKLFFHVRADVQDDRLKARLEHPWKRWKVGVEDFRNRARRDQYLIAINDMFAHTNTRWAPWTVIDGNNKKAGRIAALTAVADALEKRVPLDAPELNPEVIAIARRAFGETE